MLTRDDQGEVAREHSVHVVVLHQRGADVVLESESGHRVVDLHDPAPLPSDLVADLLASSVVLTAPLGVPGEVVTALRGRTVPGAFQASPWLRQHRPLIFDHGRCAVGSVDLRYRTELGVYPDELD